MTSDDRIELLPITDDDADRVGLFLHQNLNGRLSAKTWSEVMMPPRAAGSEPPPNHGFLLSVGGTVVGANLAFYSSRTRNGQPERFCNLAALCIREDMRPQALRLMRALLRQRDYTFTDFSPSGNVVAMNERLGFATLDPATYLVVNLPRRSRQGVEVISDLDQIAVHLTGSDAEVFTGHRAALGVRHVLLCVDGEHCHVMFRIDRRKRVRTFASLIYVGNAELYRAYGSYLAFHLLRFRALFTLAERRLIKGAPRAPHRVISGRPKMVKSKSIDAEDVDYLHSELTFVPW